MSTTCGCSRPTRSGYVICDTCKGELEQHLAEMRWLDEELDVSLTRIKGVDYNRSNRHGTDAPLPWNERASNARAEVKNELVGWVRIMASDAKRWPSDTLPDLAAWLLKRLEHIAKRDDAWVICEGIISASISARAIVFAKPAERTYIAPCAKVTIKENAVAVVIDADDLSADECTGQIMAIEGSLNATCDKCGRTCDVNQALDARDDALADRLMTADEIANFARQRYGKPVKTVANLVRSWHKRDRILPRGKSESGAPTFRYEDVCDMLIGTYGN